LGYGTIMVFVCDMNGLFASEGISVLSLGVWATAVAVRRRSRSVRRGYPKRTSVRQRYLPSACANAERCTVGDLSELRSNCRGWFRSDL